MKGETLNIYEYLDFVFYDHVSYKENGGLLMTAIRIWLGLSHWVSRLVPYWILTQKGTVISRTTVQNIIILEKETDEIKASVNAFDEEISRIGRRPD